jgi:small-conductance mechanosensitive channel
LKCGDRAAYLANEGNRLSTTSDIRYALFREFKKHGVEIPFPQRVAHLREDKT